VCARRYTRVVDELLAQILARPDDDALRAVYGDWLLERGDPRGDFIALQLREARGPSGLPSSENKRREALLAAHAKEWLGPLAAVTRAHVWRLGFLDGCELATRGKKLDDQIGHPGWATVRALRFPTDADDRRADALVLHPALRSLRALELPSERLLKLLCGNPHAANLARLAIARPPAAYAWGQLLGGEAFPSLRELRLALELRGAATMPSAWAELVESATARRLARLRVESHAGYASAWIDLLGRARLGGELVVATTEATFTLRGDALTIAPGTHAQLTSPVCFHGLSRERFSSVKLAWPGAPRVVLDQTRHLVT